MTDLVEGIHHANVALEGLDELYILIVGVLIYLINMIGILILAVTVGKAFFGYTKRLPNDQLQHSMAKGMQLALQFLLGGEILRTVTTENWDGILIVGAIIALRIVLTVTIHWESNGLGHKHLAVKAQKPE